MSANPGYVLQLTGGGVAYVLTSPLGPPTQWQLYVPRTGALTETVRDIVDDARARHGSFTDMTLNDGAVLRQINMRQRHLLSRCRDGLKGIFSKTVRTLVQGRPSGSLVGITMRGVPYLLTEAGDGYAVYLRDALLTPYVDMAGVPIANDPVDDGIPLPVEYITTTAAKGRYSDQRTVSITVKEENERTVGLPGRQLAAFMSGNRLVPERKQMNPRGFDMWAQLVDYEISYISVARVFELCNQVTFPSVLIEALVAGMCEYMANLSKEITPAERSQFAATARMKEGEIVVMAADLSGEVPSRSVIFRGA